MKKITLILISGFLLGIFAKNIFHSLVTGLNPIIAVILVLILISCFIFEIIYLHKNSVKKSIVFLTIVVNLLFIGGFIYFDKQQIQNNKSNYFAYTASSEPSKSIKTSNHNVVDSSFLGFWNKFAVIVKSKNQLKFKKISLDSMMYENKAISTKIFLSKYYSDVFDKLMLDKIEHSELDFISTEIEINKSEPVIGTQIEINSNGVKLLNIIQVNITKIDTYPEGPLTIVLEFINTKNGYKFYKYDKFG